MNTTEKRILELLQAAPLAPGALAEQTGFSRVTVHKHLKHLLGEGLIERFGSGAHVTYAVRIHGSESRVEESYTYFKQLYRPTKYQTLPLYDDLEHDLQKNSSLDLDFSYLFDKAVVYSSNIEGNSLDLSSYMNSKQLPAAQKNKEMKEIDDLQIAYQRATKLKLQESNLLALHKVLSRSFISKARSGVYRKEPVGVFSASGVEYMAIEPNLVDSEMSELFNYIDLLLRQPMQREVYYWAAWIHVMFVLIHPFSDGNGRMARLLEKWFLAEKIGYVAWGIQTEEWYFKHRKKYYDSLKLGNHYWDVDYGRAKEFMQLLPAIMGKK